MRNMFAEHLKYVKNYLIEHHGYFPPDLQYRFRCKYEHTLRVLRWCRKLAAQYPKINLEALYTAAIFHDIGYSADYDMNQHAQMGAQIFAEYAETIHMNKELAQKVTYLIHEHSNKELLQNPDTMLELIILMEADLMDEEGALRVIWYCATKGILGAESYRDLYDFIQMGSNKRLKNPMVTPLARKIWDQKIELVNRFSEELYDDIITDIDFCKR